MAQPKYSHIERERRWRVEPSQAPAVGDRPYTIIEDRYLDDTRFRVRKMTCGQTGQVSLKLSKKYDAGLATARPLVTAYLDETEYARFCGLPGVDMIKRRYKIEHDGREWSLDVFENPAVGFLILEIEAEEGLLERLLPPSWAAREVTDLVSYQCGSLARQPDPAE
ncbi:hypothetical protein [Altererythrobacter sp. MF3-039]|uniref:hypothetical protein n=1 Tax=Altererythrobacter sp. MF3-039 TaxID=3252901 RepID=UPI00390CC72A